MRMLHTMLRVKDLDTSLAFYVDTMGMKLLRKSVNEEYEYTLAFVGYADESEQAVLELTYNWATTSTRWVLRMVTLRLQLTIFMLFASNWKRKAQMCIASLGLSKVAKRSSRSCATPTVTPSNSFNRNNLLCA